MFLTGRSRERDSHHLKPHQLRERGPCLRPETSNLTKITGLPYSPFEQVHTEFITNSSLPSLESIGVRKIQHLVQVEVKIDLCHVT